LDRSLKEILQMNFVALRGQIINTKQQQRLQVFGFIEIGFMLQVNSFFGKYIPWHFALFYGLWLIRLRSSGYNTKYKHCTKQLYG